MIDMIIRVVPTGTGLSYLPIVILNEQEVYRGERQVSVGVALERCVVRMEALMGEEQ